MGLVGKFLADKLPVKEPKKKKPASLKSKGAVKVDLSRSA